MVSLRLLARDRIMMDMIGVVNASEGGPTTWKVLVVDSWTRHTVDAAITMSDLVELGVVAVHVVGTPVDPKWAGLPAIYYMTAAPTVFDSVMKEWSSPSSKPFSRLYLFTTTSLEPTKMKQLTSFQGFEPSLLKGVHNLMLSFDAVEQRVFECRVPNALRSIYNAEQEHAPLMMHLKSQLTSVCDVLGVSPEVRYFRTGSLGASFAKELAKETAKEVHREITSSRSLLVVVDRAVDLLAPALHDFTLQALTHEFLPLTEKGTITLKAQGGVSGGGNAGDGRQKILREGSRNSGELWTHVRHAHITDALSYLEAEKDNMKTSTRLKEKEFEELGVHSETVKVLPGYKQKLMDLCTIIDLIHTIERNFHGAQVYRIAMLEQTLATLRDSTGKAVSMDHAVRLVRSLVGDETVQVSSELFMRLVTLLFVQFPGIPLNHRKALMNAGGLSAEQQRTIDNLVHLAVGLNNQTSTAPIPAPDPSLFEGTMKVASLPKSMARYTHRLRGLSLALLQGQVEERTAPFVTTANTSMQWRLQKQRNTKPTSTSSTKQGGGASNTMVDPSVPVLILFVIGGITHGEISSVYETCSTYSCEVFLGSTGILKADEFFDQLSSI